MAAGNQIDVQDGIDTSGFYFQLGVAQVLLKIFIFINYFEFLVKNYIIWLIILHWFKGIEGKILGPISK